MASGSEDAQAGLRKLVPEHCGLGFVFSYLHTEDFYSLILSTSSDFPRQVYIWHRHYGSLLQAPSLRATYCGRFQEDSGVLIWC